VLEHVDDDLRGLQEIARVLRPDGKVLITVPAFMALWGLQDRFAGCVIGPWQEFVDAACWNGHCRSGEDNGEIGVRINTTELAGLDERSDDGPVFAAGVRSELMMPESGT
jgi:SAM-dependent methyltransferase